MPMSWTIRAAREEEAALLSSLAMESKAHWGYSRRQLGAWRDELTFTVATLRSSITQVAEVEGQVAGVYSLEPSPTDWSLEHFWVAPRHMGRGIGRALLEHAARKAGEGGAAGLAIDSDPGAEPFYLACGARRVGELAAPIEGEPERVRPQLYLSLA